MIQISELRAGNWLYDKTYASNNPADKNYKRRDIVQVDSFHDGYDDKQINIHSEGSCYGDSSIVGADLNDCEPIILTEEILSNSLGESCGRHSWPSFNPHISYGTYNINALSISKTYRQELGYDVCVEYSCDESNQSIEIAYIEYVHQLQNLYYVITGEDLDVIFE